MNNTVNIYCEADFPNSSLILVENISVNLSNIESTIIILFWFLIQIFGNGLLLGLIQYDRLAEDPLKRRICDQVQLRKSRHANICSKNQFFCENIVVIGISELRPGSNERYENSTFYGPFKFLIFILIFNK